MNATKIEWTDLSWNPVTGCLHGCPYCYARSMSQRFGRSFRPEFHPDRLHEPEKMKRSRKIFVCSMADLFGEWVPREWIDQVLDIVRSCPRHIFQFLTKAPERYAEIAWPENAWIGATGTDQDMADMAIDSLDRAQASIKYLSCEPLLSPIRLNGARLDWLIIGACTGRMASQPDRTWVEDLSADARRIRASLFYKPNLIGYSPIREFPSIQPQIL